MNPEDAPKYPTLTALNIHPMHRKQGTVVLRSEVKVALEDLKLYPAPLPRGRLIDAGEAERLLARVGISVKLISKALSDSVWAKKKTFAPETLALAYLWDLESRMRSLDSDMDKLRGVDPDVAAAAVRLFVDPRLAGRWFLTPLKTLSGKTPSESSKKDVLQVLGRLEHGVFG
jgi:hypothetical protein